MLSWSWRSIKLLLLHLVGFYITLPTLMMHGQTQTKLALWFSDLVWSCGLCVQFALRCSMGITVPETCWANNKFYSNKNSLLHLVGLSFPRIYEKHFEDCMRKTGSQMPLGRHSRRRAILQRILRKKSVRMVRSYSWILRNRFAFKRGREHSSLGQPQSGPQDASPCSYLVDVQRD